MTGNRVESIALMLESDAPGGAEIFLLNSAEELGARGYRVVPVLPSWKSGWLEGQFRDRGFDAVKFTLERPVDLDCARRLAMDLAAREVDVIHSHEFTMAVYGAVASRMLGRRHVITMHGNQRMMDARRRRLALRWAFATSHAAVAVSEDTRRHLLASMGLPEDAILTVPNGIPERVGDASAPRAELSLGEDEVILVAVGNLSERKGHIVLLRALRRLRDEGCTVPWRLLIAGEGPERSNLEAFLHESGMQERVHLLGHRSDIPDLQAAAEVMVMPSLWEGLPLAVLEGMFAGNAVVGSSTSGIPEAVRDGVDGFLVEPGNDEALAGTLRRLLEDPTLRGDLGASARERASARFSMSRMMDDYEALYLGHSPAALSTR